MGRRGVKAERRGLPSTSGSDAGTGAGRDAAPGTRLVPRASLPGGCGGLRALLLHPLGLQKKKKKKAAPPPSPIYSYSLVISNSHTNPHAMAEPPTSPKGHQAGGSLGPAPFVRSRSSSRIHSAFLAADPAQRGDARSGWWHPGSWAPSAAPVPKLRLTDAPLVCIFFSETSSRIGLETGKWILA